jgi:hypothetical protein
VATLCRWQVGNPDFHQPTREAHDLARAKVKGIGPRPKVRWRRDCPLCQARVAVRSVAPPCAFLALRPLAVESVG